MRAAEKVCFSCGDPIAKPVAKTSWGKRFAVVITILFFGSLALTAASFFMDKTPPFIACLASSIILLFVKRSADQTSERQA
jgi:hypothetical protein